MKKKVVIIGAGPAGLTAGYELLSKSKNYDVLILEQDKYVGGISKTVTYNGNKMDLGGHRFFTKDNKVNEIWKKVLPIQNKPAYDDKINNIVKEYPKNGLDPEKKDKVFLIRNRVSRIYYNKKFFDYPVNLSFTTIKNLGIIKTISSGFSYLKSCIIKKKEDSLENFYINRFGRKLYSIFFEGYTEKLWGISPKYIDSSWGSQRVKGLSIKEVLRDYFCRLFKKKNNNKETSLIEQFNYPKYGPGQMWEEIASRYKSLGGKLELNSKVVKIENTKDKIISIKYEYNNKIITVKSDYIISSMPIKDLIESMNNVPNIVKSIATNLPYRDFITIGLIVKKLKIKNKTKIKTINDIVPDCWIYAQSKDVKLGRIQIFNNWSPYLVNNRNTISLGLEYFCNENDEFWNKSDVELKEYAIKELEKMDILDKDEVIDYHVEKVIKAYPAYFGSYKDFDKVREYLDKYNNLYCIGRNGQHRYNNMDHSMECAITCINNILSGNISKENIWSVNTEKSYHEGK